MKKKEIQFNPDEFLKAVEDAPVNSLDHPRYEFFYPWDYAIDRQDKIVSNHDLIVSLKRQAYADYVAGFEDQQADTYRLGQSITAELRYLEGFRQFLAGYPLADLYRIFDSALAMAPWNDSLRAQVYSVYSHFASTSADPSEKMRRMRRANALYQE